jgi:hypothetical protein
MDPPWLDRSIHREKEAGVDDRHSPSGRFYIKGKAGLGQENFLSLAESRRWRIMPISMGICSSATIR